MITLTIDNYLDPTDSTDVAISSYRHQQGSEVRELVKYGVCTDFPGEVRMRNNRTGESYTLTAGTEIVVYLDEGSFHIEADGTGANVSNGRYYVYLLQNDSTKELQVEIVVSLEYYAIGGLGISSQGGGGAVIMTDPSDPCAQGEPLYQLANYGYLVSFSSMLLGLIVGSSDYSTHWELWTSPFTQSGVYRLGIVALPFRISSGTTDYVTLEFSREGVSTSWIVTMTVPQATCGYSRVGDSVEIDFGNLLECTCGSFLSAGNVAVRLSVIVRLTRIPDDDRVYGVQMTTSVGTVDISTLTDVTEHLKSLGTNERPSLSVMSTIPYLQGYSLRVNVTVRTASALTRTYSPLTTVLP